MIMAGHNFVLVTQDHAWALFDKAGTLMTPSSSAWRCNPNAAWDQLMDPCMREFYDTRVTYDQPAPPLTRARLWVGDESLAFREGAIFRNWKPHLAGAKLMADRDPGVKPARFNARVLRVPMAINEAYLPVIVPEEAHGYLDLSFGLNAPEDNPNDVVSYEVPSLAVNQRGDMLVVFGRVPVTTAAPLPQEARYSLIYNDERGLARSRLLMAGETVMMHTLSDTSTATPVTYFRIYDANDGDFLDLANASVDPADDFSFWMAHEFAKNGSTPGFRMVMGKVTPE
jgi:hypothetical protein